MNGTFGAWHSNTILWLVAWHGCDIRFGWFGVRAVRKHWTHHWLRASIQQQNSTAHILCWNCFIVLSAFLRLCGITHVAHGHTQTSLSRLIVEYHHINCTSTYLWPTANDDWDIIGVCLWESRESPYYTPRCLTDLGCLRKMLDWLFIFIFRVFPGRGHRHWSLWRLWTLHRQWKSRMCHVVWP